VRFLALLLLQQLGSGPTINMQMPDPKQISGIPLPTPGLPPGTVRVRVVRAEITDVVPGATVELIGEDRTQTAKTDATGHAEFSGLSARVTYRLATVVDGKRVESRSFMGPQQSGYRFMLVGAAAGAATAPQPAAPQQPAQPQLGAGPTMNMPMPDPKRISGLPLPTAELPVGSVRVRVVRDQLTSLVAGATVELRGAGDERTAKTDQSGHVQFDHLKPGLTYRVFATVDDKRVGSRPFQAPAQGGLRFMLVGAAAQAAAEDAGEGEAEAEGGEQAPLINPLKGAPARASAEVPAGTVEVRLTGSDGKPLSGQRVLLISMTKDQKLSQRDATTGPDGRARFEKLSASADMGYLVQSSFHGAPYNSAPFKVPEKPGMLVELKVWPPTQDGSQVTLGRESHIAIELGDEQLNVIENLSIENRGEASYDPGAVGLYFPMAEGGVSPQRPDDAPAQFVVVEKQGVAWKGVVPPGRMTLRFGFVIPFKNADVPFRQVMPVAMDGARVIVERVDGLEVEGPIAQKRDEREMSGRKFLLIWTDEPLARGSAIELGLHGLPVPDRRGPFLALAASLLVVGWGVVMARRPAKSASGDKKRKLTERRERLLGELVALETSRRAGRTDVERWKTRREDLVGTLERVYRDLDAEQA